MSQWCHVSVFGCTAQVVWQTDTSAEAIKARAEEQLSAAMSSMVTVGNTEAEEAEARKREEKRKAKEEAARLVRQPAYAGMLCIMWCQAQYQEGGWQAQQLPRPYHVKAALQTGSTGRYGFAWHLCVQKGAVEGLLHMSHLSIVLGGYSRGRGAFSIMDWCYCANPPLINVSQGKGG